MQFVNSGSRPSVVEGVFALIRAGDTEAKFEARSTLSYAEFLAAQMIITHETEMLPFSVFAVLPSESKHVCILFRQFDGFPNQPPFSLMSGEFELEVYVKYRGDETLVRQCVITSKVDTDVCEYVRKGQSILLANCITPPRWPSASVGRA
jgi:hypothetical protein